MLDQLSNIESGEDSVSSARREKLLLAQQRQGHFAADHRFNGQGRLRSALRYLVSQQMDVYVIQVLSAEEIDPEIKGDLKLLDCEDADVAEITASAPLLALQTHARRIHRRSPQFLQPPRNELLDGPHGCAGRPIGGRLFASADWLNKGVRTRWISFPHFPLGNGRCCWPSRRRLSRSIF